MIITNILKDKEIKIKLLYTILFICVYRLGIFITLPCINRNLLKNYFNSSMSNMGMWNMLNTFSGGAIENASIFALGVMPYISSSIICTLMTIASKDTVNKNIQQNLIDKYISITTLFISVLQGYFLSNYFKSISYNGLPIISCNISGINFLAINIITLAAGTSVLIWIGDMITYKGVGNGISILILVGILSKGNSLIYDILFDTKIEIKNIYEIYIFFLMLLFLIFVIIIAETGERRIAVHSISANATMDHYNKVQSYIPLKINLASVLPPIFASTLLSLPSSLPTMMSIQYVDSILVSFNQYNCVYQILFFLFIILFSYFYTNMQLNPKKIADNMIKSNIFILNIKPGKQTQRYVTFVINKIIIWGSIYLTILCMFPVILQEIFFNNKHMYFNGTNFLITITIVIDIISQMKNISIKNHYLNNKNLFIDELRRKV